MDRAGPSVNGKVKSFFRVSGGGMDPQGVGIGRGRPRPLARQGGANPGGPTDVPGGQARRGRAAKLGNGSPGGANRQGGGLPWA